MPVYSVTPDTPVHEALKVMAERDIGVVLILENGQPLGIFSERDCVYELSLNKDWALDAPIKKFMISPIYYITPDQTVEDCMVVMTAKNIRHLPVIQNNEVVGIISIGDVVKTVASEKDERIKDLENFLWVNLL